MAFYDISKGNNDDFTDEMEDITAAFRDKGFIENVKVENKKYFMQRKKAKLVKDNNDTDKEIAELEKELEKLRQKKKDLKEEEIKIAQAEKLIEEKENQGHNLE